MTNPKQLEYLKAIGIPVWVSRDRVMQVTALQPRDEKQTSDSDCFGSVDDILHDLDDTNKENIAVSPHSENKFTPTSENPAGKASLRTTTNNLKPSATHTNEIGRTEQHILYACGNLNAEWLIVGESPATSEALQNQPFTTDSGALLNNMLRSIEVHNPREDAYLINVIKDASSPANLAQSNLSLNKLLHEKIVAIKPKVILIVGQVSAQNLLQSTEPLVRLRSKTHTLPQTNIPVIVTYYPSYLLSKPADKRKAWNDLKLALSHYKTTYPVAHER